LMIVILLFLTVIFAMRREGLVYYAKVAKISDISVY